MPTSDVPLDRMLDVLREFVEEFETPSLAAYELQQQARPALTSHNLGKVIGAFTALVACRELGPEWRQTVDVRMAALREAMQRYDLTTGERHVLLMAAIDGT